MNEDDTFNALRKWTYAQIDFEMNILVDKVLNKIITSNEYSIAWLDLIKKAGWTDKEWKDSIVR